MVFKMCDKAQTIRIYNLRADTNELIGAENASIPPHTGLPANSTDIEPPEIKSGHLAVFDVKSNKWNIVDDHRGQAVYRTDTGEAICISELESPPKNVTSISSDGLYEKWDGTKWVKDEKAEKAAQLREAQETKDSLLRLATEKMKN